MVTWRALAVVAAASSVLACTTLAGLDADYVLAAPAGADDAGVGPPVDATVDTSTGDGSRPPVLDGAADVVTAPPLVPAFGYDIGATEVTRRQYDAWLATSPKTDGQPAACAWNTSFAVDPACAALACTGATCTEHPQVCVDWCDAVAFCRAAGQRLCGKIGGGAEAPGDQALASRSQWFAACSGNGQSAFPYGNGYHVAYCNGGDNQQTGCVDGGACTTVIAGASLRCATDAPDAGVVFDMSGNAAEWTDACLPGDAGAASDACRIRGGSFRSLGDAHLRCAGDSVLDVAPRGVAASDIGFRCCSR